MTKSQLIAIGLSFVSDRSWRWCYFFLLYQNVVKWSLCIPIIICDTKLQIALHCIFDRIPWVLGKVLEPNFFIFVLLFFDLPGVCLMFSGQDGTNMGRKSETHQSLHADHAGTWRRCECDFLEQVRVDAIVLAKQKAPNKTKYQLER